MTFLVHNYYKNSKNSPSSPKCARLPFHQPCKTASTFAYPPNTGKNQSSVLYQSDKQK